MKIGILGSGSWGSALSVLFGVNGFDVMQWCREEEIAKRIMTDRENAKHLPGIMYPESIKATSNFDKFFSNINDLVISVIPAQFTGGIWANIKDYLRGKVLICASKGIDTKKLKTLSDIYVDIFGSGEGYLVLSGPTFAKEVALGLPTAAVLAGEEDKVFELARILTTKTLRLYASVDVKGVEIGGALKNVIAIAAGISDGMGLGNNARAALITRGLAEIKRFGVRLGGNEESFYGLSGMGDLILTCTGDLSRNRQFGLTIGRGNMPKEGKSVVEGIYTVKAAYKISRKLRIDMPITEAVYKIIYEGLLPHRAMNELLSRPIKWE